MSWLVSAKQYIPAVIGEAWGGGYFAGYISHTADGNPTHALIVAPRETGATGTGYTLTTNLQWALNQNAGNGTNYSTTTIGTVANGAFDGAANMAIFESIGIANFPAAEFCKNLNIGGYADWYLPSRFELDIAYFNLKPSTAANLASSGINAYSVPKRTINNTTAYPAQTNLTVFTSAAQQAFVADNHWSSTEVITISTSSEAVSFSSGNQFGGGKTAALRVRAFRKLAL
jgi:hypothetical protein